MADSESEIVKSHSASPPADPALSKDRHGPQVHNSQAHNSQVHSSHSHSSHSHSSHSSHSHSPHVHSEESLRKLVNRLARLEGHIRGIKHMVQESQPCPDVLMQIAAARGALDRIARLIFDEHLTQCIARAAQDGNIDAEIEELKAAIDRFLL